MANQWIKMRTDIANDPAVIGLAKRLKLHPDCIVGKLHRFWSWADGQTEDGEIANADATWIDEYVSKDGFAQAMVMVGWLEINDAGIKIPRFDIHNGKSAKTRANNTARQFVSRNKRDKIVTEARPEEIRVDKSKIDKEKEIYKEKEKAPGWEERIYAAYPRKVGKVAALKAIGKAIEIVSNRGQAEAAQWLLDRTGVYSHLRGIVLSIEPEAANFTPHPATWFNRGSYDDDPQEWGPSTEGGLCWYREPNEADWAVLEGRSPA